MPTSWNTGLAGLNDILIEFYRCVNYMGDQITLMTTFPFLFNVAVSLSSLLHWVASVDY